MSLAHKLYKLGKFVTKEDIKKIIEVKEFKDYGSYTTLQIDFKDSKATLSKTSLDRLKTMFTKKIGGTSNSYYLYPNFEFQKEKDLYKKFKSAIYTFENSVMVYANQKNQTLAQPVLEYIRNYHDDVLGLRSLDAGNYFLVFTINGKTIYELMPEIWDNYYNEFVKVFERKITKKEYNEIYQLDPHRVYIEPKGNKNEYYEFLFQDNVDIITHKKIKCGYNPEVKFFTMDNYDSALKQQIVEKLPMSKNTASTIKRGWMYAIAYLRFNHKGLEYIILPTMVNFDADIFQKLLRFLKRSGNDLQQQVSKEESFMRRLSKQIEGFEKYPFTLDILFTDVNMTNLSVKIFATLEDVLPSRINKVVKTMKQQNITDSSFIDKNDHDITYLKDYFLQIESFAKATRTKGLDNRIKQEKIVLSKVLLGYEKIGYYELLNRFEKHREVGFDYKERKVQKRLVHSKRGGASVKEWIEYPDRFVKSEQKVLDFLEAIDAVEERSA